MFNNRPVLTLKCLLSACDNICSTLRALPLYLFLLSVDSCFTSSAQSLELPYAVGCHFVLGCLDYAQWHPNISLSHKSNFQVLWGAFYWWRQGFISVSLQMLNPDVTVYIDSIFEVFWISFEWRVGESNACVGTLYFYLGNTKHVSDFATWVTFP